MNTSVKWAAELAHVQEVSLLGTADLAFWKDRLLKLIRDATMPRQRPRFRF